MEWLFLANYCEFLAVGSPEQFRYIVSAFSKSSKPKYGAKEEGIVRLFVHRKRSSATLHPAMIHILIKEASFR